MSWFGVWGLGSDSPFPTRCRQGAAGKRVPCFWPVSVTPALLPGGALFGGFLLGSGPVPLRRAG